MGGSVGSEAAAAAVAAAFGKWESKTETGEWEVSPMSIAEKLEDAFRKKAGSCIITLAHLDTGLRKGDPDMMSYKVDFETMKQHCVEEPKRIRVMRRVEARDVKLTSEQILAIANAERKACGGSGPAKTTLRDRVQRITGAKSGWKSYNGLKHWIGNHAPIVIHVKLSNVIGYFLVDTNYKNLFETGTGRGSTNIDARKSWERHMFGDAYDKTDGKDRPKYGALNLTNDRKGVRAATCYGTSYFVLKDDVRWRCTFTSHDSCKKWAVGGTTRQFDRLCETGTTRLNDEELEHVVTQSGKPLKTGYREVQIHGPVRFNQDIAKLVVDKEVGDDVKRKATEFAKKNGFPVEFATLYEPDDTFYKADRTRI